MTARRFGSVRLRVTAAATVLVCLTLLAAAIVASRVLARSVEADGDAILVDQVDEVELLIRDGRLAEQIEAIGEETGQLQVVDASGAVIAASVGLAATVRLDVVERPPMGRQASETIDAAEVGGTPGVDLRVVARTVGSARGPLTIYGVTSLAKAQQAQDHLTEVLLVGLPALALLAALLIWWVVGRALAPVDHMRAVVDRIEATDLSDRVDAPGRRDEIGRLGATLNRMLDRLDDAARRQRLFAAAASHELRSPLSAIRTELEVGLAYPDRTDWTEVAGETLAEVERLERLASDLLQVTRLQALPAGSTDGRCELGRVVRGELERRRRHGSIAFDGDVDDVTVAGDPEAVVHLVRNLLDNAQRHARSAVTVSVRATSGDRVELLVANDGAPIDAADRQRIFDPFTRLDDARVADATGAGLGLSIARGLAAHMGGSLDAVDPPAGHGAAFRALFVLRR